MEKEQQEKTEKALISFGSGFLEKVDEAKKKQNFKSRSEYINHLLRIDLLRIDAIESEKRREAAHVQMRPVQSPES